MFLLKLAWDSRYRLPLLVTVGFMALDIRMQLDVQVYMRTVRRQPPPNPQLPGRDRTLSEGMISKNFGYGSFHCIPHTNVSMLLALSDDAITK